MKKIDNLIFDDFSDYQKNLINTLIVDSADKYNISIEDVIKKVNENSDEVLGQIDEGITDLIINRFNEEFLEKKENTKHRNCTKIVQANQALFKYMYAYLETSYSIFKSLTKRINDVETTEIDKTIICLYGNIFRMADEIVILLSHGCNIAAMQLWRSFFEHCVVLIFLTKNYSDETNERFKAASVQHLDKKVKSFEKHYKELKFDPLAESIKLYVQKQVDNVESNYPKNFTDNDYSWVVGLIPGLKKVNFYEVQKFVGLKRYRPFYISASNHCHPDYLTFVGNGYDETGKVQLHNFVQHNHDLRSLFDPAQLTIALLFDIHTNLVPLYSSDNEVDANMLILNKIVDKLHSETVEVNLNNIPL